MLIKAENIWKSFTNIDGKFDVLKGVSIDINEGERIAITGRNGMGKTTFLKILSNNLDYDQGEITYANNLNILFLDQIIEYFLAPGLTVNEHIGICLSKKDFAIKNLLSLKIKSQVKDLIKEYDLPIKNRLNNYVGQLSGGEKQIVAITCILAQKPDVLFLDEFTSSLDVLTTNLLINTLHTYTNENKTSIVFISHDHHVVDKFSNKVFSLDNMI